MKNALDKCVEKIKRHILCSIIFFFRKSHRLWDNVEKYGGARGATNDVTIWRIRVACWISKATCTHAPEHTHARVYTHTQICNSYFFSTATMATWTRLNVPLYVHCLSCYFRARSHKQRRKRVSFVCLSPRYQHGSHSTHFRNIW